MVHIFLKSFSDISMCIYMFISFHEVSLCHISNYVFIFVQLNDIFCCLATRMTLPKPSTVNRAQLAADITTGVYHYHIFYIFVIVVVIIVITVVFVVLSLMQLLLLILCHILLDKIRRV